MADIDIDRQMLVSSGKQGPGPGVRAVGLVALIVVIAALCFLGFKLASNYSVLGPSVQSSSNLDQIQEQLDDINKRLDSLEKHRRTTVTLPAKVPEKAAPVSTVNSAKPNRPASPAFTVSSASMVKPETTSTPGTQPATQPAVAALNEAAVANHEAWEATTDRLADVVGVVGSQQGELTQTRDQVNQLAAQTRRTAAQFELRRGMDAQPVGPVSLLLKDSDFKRQRYTVCVYVSSQCIELKDRAVDEVVVFAPSHDRSPLELVATKVTRNGIVGYLEIPANK
ncbi:MAG: hypothetical protein ACRD3B_14350 [Candidatus Sulfotelmatobacter sp.]